MLKHTTLLSVVHVTKHITLQTTNLELRTNLESDESDQKVISSKDFYYGCTFKKEQLLFIC